MNDRKVLILITSICLVLSSVEYGHKNKERKLILLSTPNISLLAESNNEESKVNVIGKDEKIEIARDLFDKYINENKTDLKKVETDKLDRKPIVCFTEYNINYTNLVKEDGDKFTVSIGYDIQYTNESDMWIAGNGKISENNWIRNKSNFVEIEKSGDKYVISDITTG